MIMQHKNSFLRLKLLGILCITLLGQGLFMRPALAQGDKDTRFSVISRGPGLLDIFIVNGPTNEIWMKSWTGSIWTNWRNLGKAPNGDRLYNVHAVAPGNNRWDIFSTSGAGAAASGVVWHKSFDGTVEYGWESRGNVGQAYPGGIQAVSTGNGQINLFTRYTGNIGSAQVLTKRRNANGSWIPCDTCAWTVIDTNDARERYYFSALAHSGNRLDLFKRSETTNRIFQKSFNGTFWVLNQWFDMFGEAIRTPNAVSWGTNRVDVFVRGTDNNVHINSSDDAGVHWYGWGFLGRGATNNTTDVAGVSAVAWGPNRLDVFTREATTLYYKAWTGTNWYPSQTTWENLGFMASYVTAHPPLPVSWGPSRIDLFYYHGNAQPGQPNTMTLYHKWTNGNGWGPSNTEWESLGP
jgi:hypothetical protein